MADISYLQNEDLADSDEAMEDEDDEEIGSGEGGVGVGRGDEGDEDEEGGEAPLYTLETLQPRLERYATSDVPTFRKMVGEALVNMFKAAVYYRIELQVTEQIMVFVQYVVNDPEAVVRLDLVKRLSQATMIYQESPELFGDIVNRHFLGIVMKYLEDPDSEVGQTAQMALMDLMTRGLLSKESIEHTVLPGILKMSHSTVDIQASSIILMSKVAPLIEKELTEKFFLDRFADLCSAEPFFVRKVCASNIGEICGIFGKETVEKILLPRFVSLCTDQVWGIRKACADVIVSISCCISLHHRQFTLAPIFAALLGDDSRWVRTSAFQTLGPFISTFAREYTGLTYNQYGEFSFTNHQGTELRISCSNSAEVSFNKTMMYSSVQKQPYEDVEESARQIVIMQDKSNPIDNTTATDVNKENQPTGYKIEGENANGVDPETDNVDMFNPFLYYYISPDLPLDQELVGGCKSLVVEEEVKEEAKKEEDRETVPESESETETSILRLSDLSSKSMEDRPSFPNSTAINETTNESADGNGSTGENERDENSSVSLQNTSDLLNDTMDVCNISTDRNVIGATSAPDRCTTTVDSYQSIVPQVLIDYFVSMTKPTQSVEVATVVPYHCAFSFPVVVLTLGKKNWPLLKDTYQALAGAMQWKVRCTLASSIHEIAMILGEDITNRDLVPIYNGFIKDLDEVRIGALKHLASFLRVLRPADRCQYLPRLNDFLITDNEWNWRFREELANQLLEIVTLFGPLDVSKHIAPLCLHLLVDKIAAVRHVALTLVTKIISHLSTDEALVTALVQELGDMLAVHSDKWMRRQTYALLCSQLISSGAITGERFAKEMLPYLLNLSWDRVPNVRLAVARTLARDVATMSSDWLGSAQADAVEKKLKQMQLDSDRDVRELAFIPRTDQ